ncbi:toxin CptA [Xanthomonas arboricola]|nr:toxin CptA [Xanthomonas arboricola]
MLACALGALGVLSALALGALWRSGVPPWLAMLLSVYAVLTGGRSLRLLLRSPAREVIVPWSETPASVDGAQVQGLQVTWRGPIAVVAWTGLDARRQRLHFWPDTLPAAQRRELRLAAQAHAISSRRPQVAP